MSGVRRVVSVVGTRPNYMKIVPIARILEAREDFEHTLVHTGQHYDPEMSGIFFDQLGVDAPDHLLEVGSGTHAAQAARVMERLEPLLLDIRPDLVLLPGDVNSTMAAALVATKLGLFTAHVEAGLRSFDRSMPEEVNRVVVDAVADLLFTHSPEARLNLLAEGAPEESVFDVGNTMIDSLVTMLPQASEAQMARRLDLQERSYLLVTLHRPTLTDGPLLAAALGALEAVAERLPVVFPVHPRTKARLEAEKLQARGVMLLDPLGYIEFISLLRSSAAVLTDSGGVQEESTFLGVPCFTLRENTERPITVTRGTNVLLGLNPERIASIPKMLPESDTRRSIQIEGWDGAAARRVVDVLARPDLRPRAEITYANGPRVSALD
ncbi:MAG: non-hydrolyzing UDP-N-acetylglucosamine 2-epimerase [Solirubrobacteraceae bacterium]